MALLDTAVVLAGVGYIYTAPPSTAKPVSLVAPAAPWIDHGHSSEDGLTLTPEFSTTTRRTWRARAGLRVSVDEVSIKLGWTALQTDNDTLKLFFGGGDVSAPDMFGVVKNPLPQERALFVRLVDGTREFPIYVPKVSIAPSGETSANPEDFTGYPLEATVLDDATATHLLQLLSDLLGTP